MPQQTKHIWLCEPDRETDFLNEPHLIRALEKAGWEVRLAETLAGEPSLSGYVLAGAEAAVTRFFKACPGFGGRVKFLVSDQEGTKAAMRRLKGRGLRLELVEVPVIRVRRGGRDCAALGNIDLCLQRLGSRRAMRLPTLFGSRPTAAWMISEAARRMKLDQYCQVGFGNGALAAAVSGLERTVIAPSVAVNSWVLRETGLTMVEMPLRDALFGTDCLQTARLVAVDRSCTFEVRARVLEAAAVKGPERVLILMEASAHDTPPPPATANAARASAAELASLTQGLPGWIGVPLADEGAQVTALWRAPGYAGAERADSVLPVMSFDDMFDHFRKQVTRMAGLRQRMLADRAAHFESGRS